MPSSRIHAAIDRQYQQTYNVISDLSVIKTQLTARTVECRFSPRAAVTLGYRQRDVLTGGPFTKDGRPVAHGDVGHSDERGFVHITGRIEEIIIRSGEKVTAPAAAGVPADGNRRYARTPHASWHATSWSSVARCAATGPGYSRRISSTCFIGVCSKPTLAQHLWS